MKFNFKVVALFLSYLFYTVGHNIDYTNYDLKINGNLLKMNYFVFNKKPLIQKSALSNPNWALAISLSGVCFCSK